VVFFETASFPPNLKIFADLFEGKDGSWGVAAGYFGWKRKTRDWDEEIY